MYKNLLNIIEEHLKEKYPNDKIIVRVREKSPYNYDCLEILATVGFWSSYVTVMNDEFVFYPFENTVQAIIDRTVENIEYERRRSEDGRVDS